MKSKAVAALVGLATTGLLLSPVLPAQAAAHSGQKYVNSSASDYNMIICFHGSNCKVIAPGQSYTVGSVLIAAPLTITVEGPSFRVRYDKTSGAYQGCQNTGSIDKTFEPSGAPDRIDFLSYDEKNCKHS